MSINIGSGSNDFNQLSSFAPKGAEKESKSNGINTALKMSEKDPFKDSELTKAVAQMAMMMPNIDMPNKGTIANSIV